MYKMCQIKNRGSKIYQIKNVIDDGTENEAENPNHETCTCLIFLLTVIFCTSHYLRKYEFLGIFLCELKYPSNSSLFSLLFLQVPC